MAIVTVTQALKKLYKNVVGEDTKKNNPTKIIADLADHWDGSDGGGGSSVAPLILQKEQDDTDPQEIVTYIPTSFSAIKEAFLSGRMVLLDPIDNGKTYSLMVGLRVNSSGGLLIFANDESYTATSDSEHPIQQ